MLDHHIQRAIVYRLALTDKSKFSELKPDGLESKLFTYHLKKVVSAGYVMKADDGTYVLTPEGRRLGVHVLENTKAVVDRAYSVLFLLVRRKPDGAWLLYRRKSHPLINKVGFMHLNPNSSESICKTAERECLAKTGIRARFSVRGSGYFRIFEGEKLESFTNFTLLVSEDAEGEIVQDHELAEYFWQDSIDASDSTLLPNMPLLLTHYQSKKQFFLEETIQV